jgi:hypothetical protein
MGTIPRPRIVSRSTDLEADDLPEQVTITVRELAGAVKQGLLALSDSHQRHCAYTTRVLTYYDSCQWIRIFPTTFCGRSLAWSAIAQGGFRTVRCERRCILIMHVVIRNVCGENSASTPNCTRHIPAHPHGCEPNALTN